jgi:hypothetical protein
MPAYRQIDARVRQQVTDQLQQDVDTW